MVLLSNRLPQPILQCMNTSEHPLSSGSVNTSDNSKQTWDILSPISGRVVPLEDVPQAIFSKKLLGDGVAIQPSGYQVLAPFDCKIVQLPVTGEQIRLRGKAGIQLLIQVGIGTYKIMGEGFKLHVQEGSVVKAGTVILDFNMNKIKHRIDSLLCPVTMLNSDKTLGILPNYRQAIAGEDSIFSILV